MFFSKQNIYYKNKSQFEYIPSKQLFSGEGIKVNHFYNVYHFYTPTSSQNNLGGVSYSNHKIVSLVLRNTYVYTSFSIFIVQSYSFYTANTKQSCVAKLLSNASFTLNFLSGMEYLLSLLVLYHLLRVLHGEPIG